MPESRKAASNRIRTAATRSALLASARELFAAQGYAATGTPEIVSNAAVTRGALYHNFPDKLALFRAVVEQEAEAVARHIEEQTEPTDASGSPLEAFLAGSEAYFDAMSAPGRAHLLLVEGPTVLGLSVMDEIDQRTGREQIRQGLLLALETQPANRVPPAHAVPVDALAAVLSAAFDKAALDITQDKPAEEYRAALRYLLAGIPGLESA